MKALQDWYLFLCGQKGALSANPVVKVWAKNLKRLDMK